MVKEINLEYEFDNKKCGEELYAKDWDEAKRKLQALKETILKIFVSQNNAGLIGCVNT